MSMMSLVRRKSIHLCSMCADHCISLLQTNVFLFAGEWIISSHDVECISIGAGILGCGGGGDPNVGRAAAQQLLNEGKTIRLKDPHKYDYI